MFSAECQREGVLEVETFSRLLDGHYGIDDLKFFLNARGVSRNELSEILKKEQSKTEVWNPLQPHYLTAKQCLRQSKTVFNDTNHWQQFVQLLRPFLERSEKQEMEFSRYLSLILRYFHAVNKKNVEEQRKKKPQKRVHIVEKPSSVMRTSPRKEVFKIEEENDTPTVRHMDFDDDSENMEQVLLAKLKRLQSVSSRFKRG